MVQVHHITLSRAQLDSIPEAERRLLVLMAHAANELSVLSKLFHFTAKSDSKAAVLMQAENTQALVLGRILTGKIYECWKLLKTKFFGQAISREYNHQFDQEALDALDAMKRYFGRKNLIATVRNKHAFHYSSEQVDAGYRSLVDGDPLAIYLSKSNTNTLYAFGDTIAGRAMLEDIKPGDHREAFSMLIRETSVAVGWINTIIGATMAICLTTHVGESLYALGATAIEIEGAPDSDDVSIPYFVEIAEDNIT